MAERALVGSDHYKLHHCVGVLSETLKSCVTPVDCSAFWVRGHKRPAENKNADTLLKKGVQKMLEDP